MGGYYVEGEVVSFFFSVLFWSVGEGCVLILSDVGFHSPDSR